MVVLGDFNITMNHPDMVTFANEQNFTHLIKKNTCFKGVNGSIIDLILTNRKFNFKHSSTFETGLSDHHHLILSMMKTSFRNEDPKSFVYRDFEKFTIEKLKADVTPFLQSSNNNYQNFENEIVKALDKNAPKKRKTFRGNHKPHVNKTLRKAIMKRSKLKNKANKSQLSIDFSNYKRQRNLVTRLNKQCKIDYFNNIMDTSITSKPFWNTCKPYFSNKHSKGDSKIMLIENDEVVVDNKCIANIFNSYFESITDALGLFKWPIKVKEENCNSIEMIVKAFSSHPSVIKIKSSITIKEKFLFKPVDENIVRKVINKLSSKKIISGEIPTFLLILFSKNYCVA